MNQELVERIANAVLYEGYMLYPYRPSSVKNRQRFNFGVVYPRAYAETQSGADVWFTQTECLVRTSSPEARIGVKLRFLQMVERTVARATSYPGLSGSSLPRFEPVEELVLAGRTVRGWQEAAECDLSVQDAGNRALCSQAIVRSLRLEPEENREWLRDERGQVVGAIVRRKFDVAAELLLRAVELADGIYKLQIRISNRTQIDASRSSDRRHALAHSLLSAHAILNVAGGEFVSLLEPPEECRKWAEGCENIGTWPVLAGEKGQRDTVLASPIILYDYPEIAAESPGDLFDATEIDEILSLRILTLTDDEKREVRDSDERARKVLERTEGLSVDDLLRMHGTLRRLRSLDEEGL